MSKRPRLVTAIRLSLGAFRRHDPSRFGAALAFYLLFSIAPILLFAIAVAGAFIGRQQAEREILNRIVSSVGSAAGVAIAAMIKDAAARRPGWLATIFGLITLYFGVTGVYRQIDEAIRTIWHEGADDAGKPRSLEKRLASMVFVFAAVLVVMLSVIADGAIAVTGRYAAARLVGGEWLWHAVQLVVSTFVLTALFAGVFRYLVQPRVEWRAVRRGALVTAILFVIGKFALGIYLGKAAVGSAFGAGASIVVVLLWAYWSAEIFFFGLEFTHVYAQERK